MRAKTLCLITQGGNRTHDLSLKMPKKGIKRPEYLNPFHSMRDGFGLWQKTHVFECQPPTGGVWAGYELVIKLVYPVADATIYRCSCSDPEKSLQLQSTATPGTGTRIGNDSGSISRFGFVLLLVGGTENG